MVIWNNKRRTENRRKIDLVTKEIDMDFNISQLVKITIVFVASVIAIILFDHGEET